MKLKLKIFIKTFEKIKINVIILTIQKTHRISIIPIKKGIGKFKDEAAGMPIIEFVGLRSKIYSYIKDNEKGSKTAKGIKKSFIKNNIKHDDYKKVLFKYITQ